MKHKKPVAARPAQPVLLSAWMYGVVLSVTSRPIIVFLKMPRDLRGPYPADDIPPATDVLQMFLFPFFFGGKLVQREEAALLNHYSFTICSSCDLWQGPSHSVFRLLAYIYIYFYLIPAVDLYMRIHNSPLLLLLLFWGDIHLYFYITFVILFLFFASPGRYRETGELYAG